CRGVYWPEFFIPCGLGREKVFGRFQFLIWEYIWLTIIN
ncbi:MAG: hypothetical protein AVDCRST_MAG95-3309, partial [uncultured Adhaeribacter sp.]